MPMPAFSAWRLTVSTSQRSVVLDGTSITCAPVAIFAIHLEISSEMNEPPKPKIAAISSRPWRFSPVSCASMRSMPSSCMRDAQHEQHREVGDDEQENAFHRR